MIRVASRLAALLAAMLAALLAALVLAGCGTDPPDPPTTEPVVVRAPFCDAVPAQAVEAALDTDGDALGAGRQPEVDLESWGDEPAGDSPEIGCRWSTGPVQATAYLLRDTVDATLAERMVDDATAPPCERLEGTEPFGSPGVTTVCRLSGGEGIRTGSAGLFGDAWVSCSITGTGDRARVQAWCDTVLEAVRD